ncbi:MAG: Smr/MutS family protein [Metamycoplasmataceae bacterium]
MLSLDLHGYTENQAVAKVLNFILEFEYDNHEDEALIITGKGSGSMNIIATDILDEKDNLNYEIINNGGAILIKKINNHIF